MIRMKLASIEKDKQPSQEILRLFEKTRVAYLSAIHDPTEYSGRWRKAVDMITESYEESDAAGKEMRNFIDEKDLEDYIVNNNKELKKIKKGSKDYSKKIDEEKSKMNIQRFKGLGEMNPEELWSTTLDPETRNLLQVQYSKDLKKDQSLIHTLMGNDVALRKDFIVSNAINVRNLDI